MQHDDRIRKEAIPWWMAAGRAGLGPVMLVGALAGWNRLTLAALVVAGLLSDIFDGVLARRWKCDTAAVRLFDSIADIIFYLGCATALWTQRPQLIRTLAVPIAAVLGLELLGIGFAIVKFGKPPSYHSYLAKTWGSVLATALVAAFATEHASAWIVAAVALGILSNIEGLVMSIVMPVWQQDVKTLAQAWRLRNNARRRKPGIVAKVAGAAVLLLAVATLPLHAQKPGEALYEVGTSAIKANTIAPLIATQEGIRFEAPTPLEIPYEKITKVEWRKDVREHLGFFPALFAGMFLARVHVYRMTLSYRDGEEREQAAVFQLTRDDSIKLSELLRARAPACSKAVGCRPPWNE